MKSTFETLENNRGKFVVEVPADEFEKKVAAAFKKIAKEVRLPGFRKGKVPRKVLESKFGTGVARGQALEDSIPEFFQKALLDHEVDVIGNPSYDIESGQEAGDLVFSAEMELRPEIEIEGYKDISVEVDSIEVTDKDVEAEIEQFCEQFSELKDSDTASQDGDTITVDIETTFQGERVDAMSTSDYAYKVGSGLISEEFDRNMAGLSVDQTTEFEAPHPDPSEEEELSFSVTVKAIQTPVSPEISDELVAESSDFETVADFRDDALARLSKMKRQTADNAWREKAASALGELVTADLPEAMLDTEARNSLENLAQRLAQSGIGFQQYLDMVGQDINQLLEEMRKPAAENVRVDLALRAIARNENLEATEEDVDKEFTNLAEATSQSVETLREQIGTPNQLMMLRHDIAKNKAVEWYLDQVKVLDPEGNEIDKALLEQKDDDTEDQTEPDQAHSDEAE